MPRQWRRWYGCGGGDVTRQASIETAVRRAVDEFGSLDIVVNNAGWTFRNKPMMEVTEEEFDRVFAINVKSIFLMTNAVVPVMRKQGGGNIIDIGSTAGVRPRPGLTWYNGSKGAVNPMSKSMAVELAPDRIRVNCAAPVIGDTALLEAFMGVKDTPENRARFVATAARHTGRYRQCLCLSWWRRIDLHHRCDLAGGRRPNDLAIPVVQKL